MPSLCLSESSVFSVKKALLAEYPGLGSGHLSESLAAALGYQTNAALRAALRSYENDPPIVFLSDERFQARLNALAQTNIEHWFGFTQSDAIIQTEDDNWQATEIQYKTKRQKAWRNLMVAAINAAIEQKLTSLRPGDNRWAGGNPGGFNGSEEGCIFEFDLSDGTPCQGHLRDIGTNELEVKVAIKPKANWHSYDFIGGRYSCGPVIAMSWLERYRGAWLQSADTMFYCQQSYLDSLSELRIEPMGYGDRGRLM